MATDASRRRAVDLAESVRAMAREAVLVSRGRVEGQGAAREEATEREEEADYDSLLDALKDLSGGSLANQWDMYRKATEDLVAAEKAYDEELAKYPLQVVDVALGFPLLMLSMITPLQFNGWLDCCSWGGGWTLESPVEIHERQATSVEWQVDAQGRPTKTTVNSPVK